MKGVTWVRDERYADLDVWNRDGIAWDVAPKPRHRWLHWRHRVQSHGKVVGTRVERCRCGAIRMGRETWFHDRPRTL